MRAMKIACEREASGGWGAQASPSHPTANQKLTEHYQVQRSRKSVSILNGSIEEGPEPFLSGDSRDFPVP